MTALALSLLSMNVYGRPEQSLLAQLIEHAVATLTFGNHHGIAQALFALSSSGQQSHAFRI